MKYDLDIRSIAREDQSIREKHDQFIEGLKGLGVPWGIVNEAEAPDAGSSLSATIAWAKIFGSKSGIGGYIKYVFRRKFEDEAFYDDKIMLSFNPNRIDYRNLIDNAFPRYISAFDGYFAQIIDQEFCGADWGSSPSNFDARHHLYRLPQVCYMRGDFCDRALRLNPQQVIRRIENDVAVAKEILGGVLIVLTYDILPTAEMDRLCWESKAKLVE